jgi:hypothetical protein
MRPEELKTLLTADPFKPLSLHLTDGKTIPISHPNQVIVGQESSIIGLNPNERGFVNGFAICYLPHVVRVERIAA